MTNENENGVFVYTRSYNGKAIAVVVNMKEEVKEINLPFEVNNVLLSNYNKTYNKTNKLILQPFETLVFEI